MSNLDLFNLEEENIVLKEENERLINKCNNLEGACTSQDFEILELRQQLEWIKSDLEIIKSNVLEYLQNLDNGLTDIDLKQDLISKCMLRK
jgi:hypothetical protein